MNNQLITFNGCVANLKMIPTQTGRTMVVFSVGDKSCKAFGEFADVCAKLNGAHAEITATAGQYLGKPEYAVASVKAAVVGREVSTYDSSQPAEVNGRSELEQIMQQQIAWWRRSELSNGDNASLQKIVEASDAELQQAGKSILISYREAAKQALANRAARAEEIEKNGGDIPF